MSTKVEMKEEIQQKRADAHLEEASQRFETILQAIPDNIYIIDSEGYIIDSNEKELVYGTTDELIGKNLNQVFGTENAALIMTHVKETLSDGELKTFEYRRFYNNKFYSFEARVSRMSENVVIAIVRNIDNVQRLEKHFMQINKLLQMFSHFSTQFINVPLDAFDVDAELNKALAQIGVSTGVDKACIFEYDTQRHVLKRSNGWQADKESLNQENPFECNVDILTEWVDRLKERKAIIVKNIQKELEPNSHLYKIMAAQDVISFLTIPLMKNEELTGLIILTSTKSKIDFT